MELFPRIIIIRVAKSSECTTKFVILGLALLRFLVFTETSHMGEQILQWLFIDIVISPADGQSIACGEDRNQILVSYILHIANASHIPFRT